jgi:eukaryotic-like serine/threonine-protein kinase
MPKFASNAGRAYFVGNGMSDQQPPNSRDDGGDVGTSSGVADVSAPSDRAPLVLPLSTRPPPVSRPDPYVGKTFDGRYFIERLIGEGGMGVVYAARHKIIDKRVAIKVLRGEMAKDREVTQRFLQEAKAASAIGNPHIVDISDFGTLPDGAEFFVMELLDGRSLVQALEAKCPLPLPRLLHIAKQVARGLAAAHTAGIIHRDLKPDNVMLVVRGTERDFVKILDFGIAKVGAGPSRITVQGTVFGTPHYMSPEQASGAGVDLRTDIYSFGVMLYEMASGKLPFDADNFMGILTQHMYKAPVPMRAHVPPIDVPPGLDAIVLKCLTKKPDGRYPTMNALIDDLEALERGTPPDAMIDLEQPSGGFNAPADYFRPISTSVAAMPGDVNPRPAWMAYAGLAVVVAIIGATIVVVAASGGESVAVAPATNLASDAAAGEGVSFGPLASKDHESMHEERKQVLLGVEPVDSKVARDGKDLGSAPIAVELASDERALVTISRDGYTTRTLALDGSQPKVVVKLVPLASVRVPSPGKTSAQPRQQPSHKTVTPSTSDLDDPWKK